MNTKFSNLKILLAIGMDFILGHQTIQDSCKGIAPRAFIVTDPAQICYNLIK
jgi:hypothetical protein